MPYKIKLLLFFVLALMGNFAYGIETFYSSVEDSLGIGKGIEYQEDADGRQSFESIQGADGWLVNQESVFNQGYNASTWWLRFEVSNTTETENFLLAIDYSVLDYINVFLVDDEGQVEQYNLGDKLPFDSRPIVHRNFLVPINLKQNHSEVIYIQVRSTSSIQVPLSLWKTEQFHSSEVGRTALKGLYFGGLLIICAYNLLLYIALGERTYLYYVGWVFGMFMFLAALDGWAYQYLWPTANQWNDRAILVSLTGLIFFAYLFVGRFLNIPSMNKVIVGMHYTGLFLCTVLAIASFYLPYNIVIKFLVPFAALACINACIGGGYALRAGQPSAGIYLVAWSMLLAGGIILVLNKLHVIPRNVVTDSATQIGSLAEVLLLSFALAERINRERALRIEAQQESLDLQKQTNEELELRVSDRTLALEKANKMLEQLSNTDQLTNLKNRRFLNEYLECQVDWCARSNENMAVILVDIDHFKSINDTHGHQVGDDCLEEVARRLAITIHQEKDLVARYGGEEFCIVLPETKAEGAEIVAEKLRKRIAEESIKTRGSDLNLTISLGLYVASPSEGDQYQQYLEKADEALYKAKHNGRNRVERA